MKKIFSYNVDIDKTAYMNWRTRPHQPIHSDYDSRNIEILKRIMLVDENDSQKIYGKTGSGNGEAWFVGFSESSGERRYIAIYLNDSEHRDQVSGNKAKEIALDILQDGF